MKSDDVITLSHGGGGILTRDLVGEIFLPELANPILSRLEDSALLDLHGGRVAFTTDSFVVKPLFFRGGDIGRLCVSGTVNDLVVSGATPLYIALSLIIEEGLEAGVLRRVARSIAATAAEAGVEIATGDTKVVERGAADGLFVTTTGVGIVPEGIDVGARNIRPGDRLIISGTLGDHGVAVMSEREGIRFETPVRSDVAPLASLAKCALEAGEVHAMRDPTRGGAAAALNEMAGAAGVGVVIEEERLPVRPEVSSACGLLGLDPLNAANEGKIVFFVAEADAGRISDALRSHPLGRDAETAGAAVDDHPGMVVVKTRIGGGRILHMPAGEGLPRIC